MADPNRPMEATIEWRLNSAGQMQPFPVEVPAVVKEDMTLLHWAALSMPYVGKRKVIKVEDEDGNQSYKESHEFLNEFEEQNHGRRNIEVIARRKAQNAAAGDNELIKYIEDRTLGKPVQASINVNAQGTFADLAAALMQADIEDPLPPPPQLRVVELANHEDESDDGEAEIINVSRRIKDPLEGF